MNLVVNARDDMPNGGSWLSQHQRQTDQEYARTQPDAPANYVMPSVSDTGIGMTDKVKALLFEAFLRHRHWARASWVRLRPASPLSTECGGQASA
jgi:signal transduction histidine kinase